MVNISFQRRDVLKMATGLSLTAVAGCIGVLSGQESPDYVDAIPRNQSNEEGVFFVHIDAEWLRTFDWEAELPYAEQLPDAVDIDLDPETPPINVDPLLAYPTTGLIAGAFGIGLGLIRYGFGDVILDGLDEEITPIETDEIQTPEEEADVDGNVRIDSMLLVNGVGVFRGEFDARSMVAAARDFEPAREQDGFDVYEGTDDGFLGTEGLVFAVRDDVLVTLLDVDADLESILSTLAGDVERLGDTDDGRWALSTAEKGHVTLGAWGIQVAQAAEANEDRKFVDTGDVLEHANGLVSSITLGPDEGVGTIAAVYPPNETPQRTAFENQVGTSASSREIEVDDTRVSINGIWRVPDTDTEG